MRAADLPEAAKIVDRLSYIAKMRAAKLREITIAREGMHGQTIGASTELAANIMAWVIDALDREEANLRRRAAQLGLSLESK